MWLTPKKPWKKKPSIVKEGLELIDVETSQVNDLVQYVTIFESTKLKFEKITLGYGIDCAKSLWLDCATKLTSTHEMLETTFPYRVAFTSMRQIEVYF